jgi:hypothetical protein
MRAEQFEFVDGRRGVMAQLVWQRYTITCTEWPGTLLSMAQADVLGPLAKAEALRLA